MRAIFAVLLGMLPVFALPGIALAEGVVAGISLSAQLMRVCHENRFLYEWPVSTAKAGKITPTGIYHPEFLSKNHRSSRYNNAPMPHAIFYSGHYAIHGTDQIDRLGSPASRGCVRLHPDHARILFQMVRSVGMANTQVVIVQ